MSAQKLAKVVGDYLGLHMITNTIQEILEIELISGENSAKQLLPGLRIRIWTSWNWLKIWVFINIPSQKIFILMIMKEETWLNTVNKSFHLHKLVLKDKWWYFQRIFSYAFPNCQALFAFDNVTNHACYTKNTLLAKKMNLGMGRKQPRMRNRFNDII